MPTILLVDDEQEVLEYLRFVLERKGPTVLCAKSAEGALAVSHQYPGMINLLLSDMTLQHMNGAQLATAIRKQRPSMAVVLMSGWPEEDLPGVAGRFLKKPFKQTELIEVIESACAQPGKNTGSKIEQQ